MEEAPVALLKVPAGQGEGTFVAAGQKDPAVQLLQNVCKPRLTVQLRMPFEGPCRHMAPPPFLPMNAKLCRQGEKDFVVTPTDARAAYSAGLVLGVSWLGPVSCTAIRTIVPLGIAFSV